MAELIRRPELNYVMLTELDPKRPELPTDVIEQVDINIKYDGYIRRQKQQVAQYKKLENKKLDANFDYSSVKSLRKEAAQKLDLYRPMSIGQASRISGVSPADISVLLVHLEQLRYQNRMEKDSIPEPELERKAERLASSRGTEEVTGKDVSDDSRI